MSLVLPKTVGFSVNDRRRKTMFDIRIFEPDSKNDLEEIKQTIKIEESTKELKKNRYLSVSNDYNSELIKFRSSSADRLDKFAP